MVWLLLMCTETMILRLVTLTATQGLAKPALGRFSGQLFGCGQAMRSSRFAKSTLALEPTFVWSSPGRDNTLFDTSFFLNFLFFYSKLSNQIFAEETTLRVTWRIPSIQAIISVAILILMLTKNGRCHGLRAVQVGNLTLFVLNIVKIEFRKFTRNQ